MGTSIGVGLTHPKDAGRDKVYSSSSPHVTLPTGVIVSRFSSAGWLVGSSMHLAEWHPTRATLSEPMSLIQVFRMSPEFPSFLEALGINSNSLPS